SRSSSRQVYPVLMHASIEGRTGHAQGFCGGDRLAVTDQCIEQRLTLWTIGGLVAASRRQGVEPRILYVQSSLQVIQAPQKRLLKNRVAVPKPASLSNCCIAASECGGSAP